jgi:glycine hydroxymethyltransferase
MTDFLFRGSLADLDLDVSELIQFEAERQARKIILIPSESQAPSAVREAIGSEFQNVYAEGYPDEKTRSLVEDEILDYDARLAEYRRYSDPRYYKGVEYADIAEALARRRCAKAFAANGVNADDIYVNVQALSGSPANNAVYHALVQPGDTIMGMNLLHGGHLSHGSSVHRSGKYYNVIHYGVDPDTELINYDEIARLAEQHKPKFIIAGFSSYPWTFDWEKFQSIARAVGAYLFADIAHVAGLVATGLFPSPVGIADVVTFTTHKTLCGPRGACILTTNRLLARKIDRAVFPGEQGGPHVNNFVAMATAFKLAQTEQFKQLQHQVVQNAMTLASRLAERGFRIPYGGTDTHLVNLDCSSVIGQDGTTLSGDQAARILDIAGLVVNRNTIPGDKSAVDPSGIRMGTPWVTQRGFKEEQIKRVGDIIADVLLSTKPYAIKGRRGVRRRAKINFVKLEDAKVSSRDLAQEAGVDFKTEYHGYPHFYYIDDKTDEEIVTFEIGGERVRSFLNFASSNDVEALEAGQSQATTIHTPMGNVDGSLARADEDGFLLSVPGKRSGVVAAWLRDLSDGYIEFDKDNLKKLPGPVWVKKYLREATYAEGDSIGKQKPYFIGMSVANGTPLPEFNWDEKEGNIRRTPIYGTHKELGAKLIPFAGWELPVWYTSVVDEHLAVRQAAGLFDVSHMGVYQLEGPDASVFLDCVVGNDVSGLDVGESCYTHFLGPDGSVIDDCLVYRRNVEKFLVVVNASNDDKDWAWLNAVKNGEVRVSKTNPWTRVYGRNVTLRNLRDTSAGEDMRVDIALQGPRSREILLSMGIDAITRNRIMRLKRTQLCDATVGDYDLIVSRTGYTGEKMAFELFVHPDLAENLFKRLLDVGDEFGLKPIGLGARDSLRTEAGLPLYGLEMGGEEDLGVGDAGFGSYVKTYKPWFIGREAFLTQEASRTGVVVRYRFNEKGVRMAHYKDPVMDKRGRVVGFVTSCAIDMEGFLTGQAYLELKSTEIGTPIYVYQSASPRAAKAPAELHVGDRVTMPSAATVISRFPKL